MNGYLTMETLTFIAEQENALLKRIKKYLTDNQSLIVTGLITLSGDYRSYSI